MPATLVKSSNPTQIGVDPVLYLHRFPGLSHASGVATGPTTALVAVRYNVEAPANLWWRIKSGSPPTLLSEILQANNSIQVDEEAGLVGIASGINPGTLVASTTYWVGWVIEYADGTYSDLEVSESFATPGASAAAPTFVNLSNTTISETLPSGSVVGTLSADGSPAPTFTITSDPDNKFDISGSNIITTDTFDFATDASHPVTAQATNSEGNASQAFTITVTEDTGGTVDGAYGPEFLGDFRQVAAIPVSYTANTGTVTEATPATFDAAVAALTNNAVLRLAAGSYGNRTISGLAPATRVTLVSTVREGAIFGNLTIKNDCDNITIKGVKATGQIRVEGASGVIVEYCFANSTENRAVGGVIPTGNIFRYNVCDRNWPGTGGMAHYDRDTADTQILNCILMRSSEDNMKLESSTGAYVDRCVFYEARSENGTGTHNDGLQITTLEYDARGLGEWADGITIRRSLFWDPNNKDYRRMQGIFGGGSGYHYRNTIYEQNMSATFQNAPCIAMLSYNGTGQIIRNNASWNAIRYAGEISITDNIAGGVIFTSDPSPDATITGNIQASGSVNTVFAGTGSWPTSWRDFKGIGSAAGKGAATFIATLESEWGT